MASIDIGGGSTGGPGSGAGGTYQDWLDNGNVGTFAEYFALIKGPKGDKGDDGDSIKGDPGSSAYELWLAAGNSGTVPEFLATLKGAKGDLGNDGASAYELWLAAGNSGNVAQYLASLKGDPGNDGNDGTDGTDGTDGSSAYEVWLAAGNAGTQAEFLASLKGAKGDTGAMAGQEIASVDILSAVPIAVNNTYYTQGQIVVPANTPAHEIEVVNGILLQIQTGTQPIGTALRADVSIFDELNNLLAYNARTVIQDTAATTKGTQDVVPCKVSLPATPPDTAKTYTVQVRGFNMANGSTTGVLIGGAFPSRKLVARYR
jgi:hypothetical protein